MVQNMQFYFGFGKSNLIYLYKFQASDTSKIIKSSNQTSNGTLNINSSVIEEDNFNVTEHRGFVHGFVEALSVILVRSIYKNK